MAAPSEFLSGPPEQQANTSASQASSVAGVASQYGFPQGPSKVGGKRDRKSQGVADQQDSTKRARQEAQSSQQKVPTNKSTKVPSNTTNDSDVPRLPSDTPPGNDDRQSGSSQPAAASLHARAGTTHALEIDVHVDRMREPVQGPTIRMDKKVREIKTSILRHLQKLEVLIVGPPHDIALRALWLPGDVPELKEVAEVTQVQVEGTQYDAVKLRVRAAAPRNKW